MKTLKAVVKRDLETGLLVAHVPGVPGAHSQGVSAGELRANLKEVITMLLEADDPESEGIVDGVQ